MQILWPATLNLLWLIPLLIAAYIWMLKRRKRYTVRYSSLSLIRDALPKTPQWRRHLPFAFFIVALAALTVAFSRPVTVVSVPARRATILLAMDVSRSMCATDIAPNRLEAAKSAALSFIKNQKSSMQIGIVAFAGFAELIQEPTTNKNLLTNAVEGLTTARRTAIGSAILESLDALAATDDSIAPIGTLDSLNSQSDQLVPQGEYVPAIIVLLTDGVSNSGPFPLDAAKEAAARGVRVYTIGFGTYNPVSLRDCNSFGFQEQWGNNSGGFYRGIDEATLQEISRMTGGEYYSATSADELQSVFEHLPTYMITEEEKMEVSVFFTALGAFAAMLAIVLSMLWHPVS